MSLFFGAFELSVPHRELNWNGRRVEIGDRALNLLIALVAQAGKPISKEQLTKVVWGGRAIGTSNLTVQVATLRRILSDADGNAASPELIRTLPGYGYIFTAPTDRARVTTQSDDTARRAGTTTSRALAEPSEPLTLFIGREDERRELIQLLQVARLVCMVGMGGVGKTRLAIQLWRELAAHYAEGVTFVDLAPLTNPDQVGEAIAAAIGANDGGASAQAALVAALRASRRLLILDNAEHVITGVRHLVGLVLGACPGVSALVTSRESLGVPGERVFRLSPLSLPSAPGTITAAEAIGYTAIQLFADRAQALLPGFALTDANATDVADICRRLDGIALAIEMAVPRLDVLSTRQLAERLQDRFGTVARPRHAVLARQRTLLAMFDWSWEMLATRERRLLQLVGVCPAGATLAGLETLSVADAGNDPCAKDDTLEQITALAQKSLLAINQLHQEKEAEPRYRLLETTRQYVLDQLDPQQHDALNRLHALHVAALFERAGTEWPVTHSAVWLGRYGAEADNLRAAMQWAFDRPEKETELALRLVAASFSLWWELPALPLREARRWYTLAATRIASTTPPCIQGWLWLGQSWTDTIDGDLENYPAAERAVSLFRGCDDVVGLGAALWRAASTVMFREHDPSDAALLEEATQVLEQQPATKWRALCHVRKADLLQHRGALREALAEYDLALAMVRKTGHTYGLMVCGGNRSYTLFQLGRPEEAIAALKALHQELPPGLGRSLISQLAVVLAAAGHGVEARDAIVASLADTLSIGIIATSGRTIEALALLEGQSGEIEAAARLFGYVLKLHAPGRKRFGPRQIVYDRLKSLLEAVLPPRRREQLMAEGAAWTEAEAAEAVVRICEPSPATSL